MSSSENVSRVNLLFGERQAISERLSSKHAAKLGMAALLVLGISLGANTATIENSTMTETAPLVLNGASIAVWASYAAARFKRSRGEQRIGEIDNELRPLLCLRKTVAELDGKHESEATPDQTAALDVSVVEVVKGEDGLMSQEKCRVANCPARCQVEVLEADQTVLVWGGFNSDPTSLERCIMLEPQWRGDPA